MNDPFVSSYSWFMTSYCQHGD